MTGRLLFLLPQITDTPEKYFRPVQKNGSKWDLMI